MFLLLQVNALFSAQQPFVETPLGPLELAIQELDKDFHATLKKIEVETSTVAAKTEEAKMVGESYQERIKAVSDALEAEQKKATQEELAALENAKQDLQDARLEMNKHISLIESTTLSEEKKLESMDIVLACLKRIQDDIAKVGVASVVLTGIAGSAGTICQHIGVLLPGGVGAAAAGIFAVVQFGIDIYSSGKELDEVNRAEAACDPKKIKDPLLRDRADKIRVEMDMIKHELGDGTKMLQSIIDTAGEIKNKARGLAKEIEDGVTSAVQQFSAGLDAVGSKLVNIFKKSEENTLAAVEKKAEPMKHEIDIETAQQMIATATKMITDFIGKLGSRMWGGITKAQELIDALGVLNDEKVILGNSNVKPLHLIDVPDMSVFFQALDSLKVALKEYVTMTDPGFFSATIYLENLKDQRLVFGLLDALVQETIPAFMELLTDNPEKVTGYERNYLSLARFIKSFTSR